MFAIAYLKLELLGQVRAATAMAQMCIAFRVCVQVLVLGGVESLAIIQSHLGMILVSLRNWYNITSISILMFNCNARLV